jgi:hypothetical protein
MRPVVALIGQRAAGTKVDDQVFEAANTVTTQASRGIT